MYGPTSEKEKSPDKEVSKTHQKKMMHRKHRTSLGVNNKMLTLRNNKKSAKTRMTKNKNRRKDLLENQPSDAELPRKSVNRRPVKKVKSEADIITKIIGSL